MGENEFRVREVKRYVVTHFKSDGKGNGSCRQIGEYPNIDQADEVASALQKINPGSTFATIEERRTPLVEVYAYTEEQADKLRSFIG